MTRTSRPVHAKRRKGKSVVTVQSAPPDVLPGDAAGGPDALMPGATQQPGPGAPPIRRPVDIEHLDERGGGSVEAVSAPDTESGVSGFIDATGEGPEGTESPPHLREA